MAKKPRPASKSTPIESIRHKDRRANIPTEELRDFVAEDEHAPKTMLYPRDPSLDPQLVWKGKDEQDRQDLAVPVVPVYIQEKIHPRALIENLRDTAGPGELEPEAQLFLDFNGIERDFSRKVDFYSHDSASQPHWSNRMILGDSLLVMTSLAEKEGLKGQVQMVYLDPPYGIKFGSNWQVSTRKRDVKDGKAEDATRQPEQIRAFRDTWQLGVNSYLAYLRDRLTVARELLTESGSVFVQIGDENVHLVRNILDEVFGSYNFCSLISFRTTSSLGGDLLGKSCDYVLWYAKQSEQVKFRQVYKSRGYDDDVGGRFTRVQLSDGTRRVMTTEERNDIGRLPPNSRIYRHDNLTSQSGTEKSAYGVRFQGRVFKPGNGFWKTNEIGMALLERAERIAAPTPNSLGYVRFIDDFPVSTFSNVWTDTQTGAFTEDKIYVVQTNAKVIERCLLMTTDPGDLVLDPTCGSGTTAYVAEQWGRRWITCDTSRVAVALARTRLMAAKYPYYLLADSAEGEKKEAELRPSRDREGAIAFGDARDAAHESHATPSLADARGSERGNDIKRGFVYKRVPHVTLKAIANNEEIDAINADFTPRIDKALAALNKAAKKNWQEWEVPRELTADNTDNADKKASAKSASSAVQPHAEFCTLRRERQKRIDDSIARRADTELLYDQPYENKQVIRVTGPFSVESLSPHRTISVEEKKRRAEVGKNGWKMRVIGPDDFAHMVLDNLRKAGVQNTRKAERLTFDSLEPYAGEWIHGQGNYSEADGTPRRAAVCIGPEHGTVGATLVKEAAKEAVKGVGFDVLIVCGFAFDPSVSEEAKRYGKLVVLPTKMNPDLAMGDELLKKTGAGNLFMVFGEPDVAIESDGDGKLTVEIKGVDVYDPTTGAIRSSSTDDIACWFIDSEYNGESFFVRHAYFTGAAKDGEGPYDRLKRALRAEIDEAAWATLYSTTSRPFAKPSTGKIAVKVINHYGDEVLKVFEIK